jgi:hypothetical protein
MNKLFTKLENMVISDIPTLEALCSIMYELQNDWSDSVSERTNRLTVRSNMNYWWSYFKEPEKLAVSIRNSDDRYELGYSKLSYYSNHYDYKGYRFTTFEDLMVNVKIKSFLDD